MATGLMPDEPGQLKSVAIVETGFSALTTAGFITRAVRRKSPRTRQSLCNSSGWLLIIITSLAAAILIFSDNRDDTLLTKLGLLLAACSIMLTHHGVSAEINQYNFFHPAMKNAADH